MEKKSSYKRLIFVVDDETDICELVCLHLRKNGFDAEEFFNAKEFLERFDKKKPDLVILDLMLPDIDGFDVCRIIRKKSDIPIIMLTAKGEETDRIIGLELGADDYVVKPFSPRELVARVKAVLRRWDRTESDSEEEIVVGDILKIYPERFEVFVQEKKIKLTTTEFKILLALSSKKGKVLTRDQILDRLWGGERFVVDRTIDVHIKKLREKLGPASVFIKSVRGVGYKIEE